MSIFSALKRLMLPPLPKALRDRDELAVSDIRRKFYPELSMSDEEFGQLWSDIAAVFYVPPGRVRPTDRFGVELPERASLAGSDEDIVLGGLLTRYEARFGIKTRMPNPATVDDVISLLAARRKST